MIIDDIRISRKVFYQVRGVCPDRLIFTPKGYQEFLYHLDANRYIVKIGTNNHYNVREFMGMEIRVTYGMSTDFEVLGGVQW